MIEVVPKSWEQVLGIKRSAGVFKDNWLCGVLTKPCFLYDMMQRGRGRGSFMVRPLSGTCRLTLTPVR